MRWWGWGDDEHGGGLPDSADGFLREEIGAEPGEPTPHVPLDAVRLPEPALDARVRDELAAVVGEAASPRNMPIASSMPPAGATRTSSASARATG